MHRGAVRERGAAMVEMALVLPLLVLALMGLVDLGRLALAEVMVTNAAREGVRMTAMGYTTTDARTRATAALPEVGVYGGVGAMSFPECPPSPTPTQSVNGTVAVANFQWIAVDDVAALFGVTINTPQVEGKANMRCLG